MFNIVLLSPEIPQNTGNIARTCACTQATLHLIKPFNFEVSDKHLKRAGLDYWDKVKVFYYDSFTDFIDKHGDSTLYYIETGSGKVYSDINFKPSDFLIFGQETKGISKDILDKNKDKVISVPMANNTRSLNLSNCVALVLYEGLRQNGFRF